MSKSTPEKHTLTYRTVRGLDIQLDYILPENHDGKEKLPVVVWFHGGGLLQGSRKTPYSHLTRAPSKYNLALISADYRLAPQTRFPQILSDLTSLFTYILSPAFETATKGVFDVSRIVTCGSSAGGWLSLLSGLKIGFEESGQEWEQKLGDGRVKGVVGIYPITTVEDKFWHTKQHPVSYFDRVLEEPEMREYLDPKAKEISSNEDDPDRNKMYTYMIQEGILQNLLLDGTKVDPSAFTVAKAVRSGKTVSPVPPTYLVHGTADDKVPHNQSVEVVEAFREKGLEHLITYEEREGLDHSFDAKEEEECKAMWDWIVQKFKE
ncbi:hypothetical protein JCM16303_004832 [Sporobolomyces ruberrimus]